MAALYPKLMGLERRNRDFARIKNWRDPNFTKGARAGNLSEGIASVLEEHGGTLDIGFLGGNLSPHARQQDFAGAFSPHWG